MGSNRTVARASRRIAHLALAVLVMTFFLVGFVAITTARRVNASFNVWRPRSATAMRTIVPRSDEFRGVVRALMMFAEAVAEEILVFFWKPRSG